MTDHPAKAATRAETAGGYIDAAKDAMDKRPIEVAQVYATLAVAEAILSVGQREAVDVEAIVDAQKSDIADYVQREGGRRIRRSRKLS